MGYAERSVVDTKIDTELKKLDRIQGLAIKSTLMITEEQMVTMNLDDDFLKKTLTNEIVDALLHEKCIEFTKENDLSIGSILIRARLFAVPNEQVQLLRKEYGFK